MLYFKDLADYLMEMLTKGGFVFVDLLALMLVVVQRDVAETLFTLGKNGNTLVLKYLN